MLNIYNKKVYLASGSTDMRKSINGLTALIQESFNLNPFEECVSVFCNRPTEKIQIIHWENNGFWLHYKRLEKDSFKWPEISGDTIEVTERELRWLLDGLSISQKNAHNKLHYSMVV